MKRAQHNDIGSLHSKDIMRSLRAAASVILVIALISSMSPLLAQPRYVVQDIGDFVPRDINFHGQVAGFRGGINPYRAVRWHNGVLLTYPGLGGHAIATGINDSGVMCGFALDLSGQMHAVVFGNDTSITLLPDPPSIASRATAINNFGHVTGMVRFCDTTGCNRAVVWRGGPPIDLGAFGQYGSLANGLNNMGLVVGSSEAPPTFHQRAFKTTGTGLTDLGTLGGPMSEAMAVNDSGVIVGISRTTAGVDHAVMWAPNIVDLQTFPVQRSIARDINESNLIVGQTVEMSGNPRAFLWKDGIMYNLNTLIDSTEGWILYDAVAINDRGQIVGRGTHNGVGRAFLLDPKPLMIQRPRAGDLWIAGERDTVRWFSALPPGSLVDISYTEDDGVNWWVIEEAYPADSQKVVWEIPRDILSRKCRILIEELNSGEADTSATFKIKGYVLTRDSAGQYEPFRFSEDRWSFGNQRENMWPQSWWQQFNYSGIDPFTGGLYGSIIPFRWPFSGAHASEFPDWPLFVTTFGLDQCYFSTTGGIYKPSALLAWNARKGRWGGSCVGFPISSLLAFSYSTDFRSRYPGLGSFDNLVSLPLSDQTRRIVNEFWVANNAGQQHVQFRLQSAQKTPTQTINELKHLLSQDRPNPAALFLANNSNNGSPAHGILLYELFRDETDSSVYHVLVYDNVAPAHHRSIRVETSAYGGHGSWSYDLFPSWGGAWLLFLLDPVDTYFSPPIIGSASSLAQPLATKEVLLGTTTDPPVIYPSAEADILITNASGDSIGWRNGVVINQMPGAVPFVPLTATETPPLSYHLPVGQHTIRLDRILGATTQLSIFTDNHLFNYRREDADSNDVDILEFDGALSLVNRDTRQKSVSVTGLRKDSTISEKVFTVRNCPVSVSDSMRFGFLTSDQFKIQNIGVPKNYGLLVELATASANPHFYAPQVSIPANSSHLVTPNWSDFSTVTIYVDLGNNGTIDDTLFINNTVSVDEQGSISLPAEYHLAQNYPNPFNPVTNFKFSLPAGQAGIVNSQLTILKVYNMLGQEVATLVNEVKQPGSYEVTWDASGFASGVYFYRLQAGAFVQTKKLILLR